MSISTKHLTKCFNNENYFLKGIASLFGLGPAAALDLATLGCGSSLGLASGIGLAGNQYGADCGNFAGGFGGPGGNCCDPCGGPVQVPVIARPVLPYFRTTRRGYPKW